MLASLAFLFPLASPICVFSPCCCLPRTGEDPGPPVIIREDAGPTFKTKKDTSEERSKYSTVVIVLLVIACLVPMLQYYVRSRVWWPVFPLVCLERRGA